jgi:glycosyltransferase involved in cell wall biosynthesis
MNSRSLTINLVLGHQIPFPPTQGGGVNNLIWMLAKRFAARQHKVVVYSPSAEGLAPNETDAFGIEHVRVRGRPMHPNVWINNLQAFPYSVRLWSQLRSADITSFHTPFSFILRHKPGLGVCTHTIHRTPKWFTRIYGALDRVYAGSHAVVRQAEAIAPRLRGKLKAIYNCIELPDSPPASETRDTITFLYVGRFVPDKGLESLIRGFLTAAGGSDGIRLRIVGPQTAHEGADVDFFQRMRALVSQHTAGDSVSFEPSIYDRERLFAEIRRASVFCLPSLTGETFSLAALEAMSCAKPLFVSDFGPMPEMVTAGENGYIAKAGDAEAWSEGVRYFAAHRSQIAAMGLRSFERARDCFSAERIAGEYLNDFCSLIDRNKPGIASTRSAFTTT